MKLTSTFREFELDLAEVKIAYLNWAIGYMKEPSPRYRHLFFWEDYPPGFYITHSKYGRSFSLSLFGCGVRGVPKSEALGRRLGIDKADIELKNRLTTNTRKIRDAIKSYLVAGDIQKARDMVLNFYWLKLGAHELLFDRIQYRRDQTGQLIKGRWGLEPEDYNSLTGIRNRIVNVVRYGEDLEDACVENLDRKLPGFSRGTQSTFLSSAMSWNRYALCSFDCGPALWSKRKFVHFSQVKKRMNQIGWPYRGTASEVLRPLYTIALNYRKPPIRINEPNQGYTLESMRQRRDELYEVFDRILDEIHEIRNGIRG
jgi:hypothetical protein